MADEGRLTVGLTGGLASGKSTVARGLATRGFTVFDADRLVAELYRPGEPGAAAVAELFGDELIAADGAVDRARLARIVFSSQSDRRRLEAAIHPLVRRRFEELAAAHRGVIVLEGTLLAEAGFADELDYMVTVEAEAELRLRRAVARGMSEADAFARLRAQGTGEARRRAADRTLVNDGSLDELERAIDQLALDLQTMSRGRGADRDHGEARE